MRKVECRLRNANRRMMKCRVLLALVLSSMWLMANATKRIEPVLDSLCVVVYLNEAGDARVMEKRVMRVEGDYEEGYTIIPPLMEGSHLKRFRVFDDRGDFYYQYVADWSTVNGVAGKTDKCGIMYGDDGGYKLCWGMGHEGYREYWVEYVLTDVVRGYADCDAFVRQFIAPDVMPLPRFFCVIVSLDGHDFAKGEVKAQVDDFPEKVRLSDNVTVWPKSRKRLKPGEFITLECQFKKGIFAPRLVTDERYTQVLASRGRSTDKKSSAHPDNVQSLRSWLLIFVLGLCVGCLLMVVGVIVLRALRLRKQENDS